MTLKEISRVELIAEVVSQASSVIMTDTSTVSPLSPGVRGGRPAHGPMPVYPQTWQVLQPATSAPSCAYGKRPRPATGGATVGEDMPAFRNAYAWHTEGAEISDTRAPLAPVRKRRYERS